MGPAWPERSFSSTIWPVIPPGHGTETHLESCGRPAQNTQICAHHRRRRHTQHAAPNGGYRVSAIAQLSPSVTKRQYPGLLRSWALIVTGSGRPQVNRGHLLEGYGGLGRLHRRFVLARLLVYRRRRLALIDTRDVARMHRKALTLRRLGDRQYERYAYVLIAEQEANRALAGFPEEAWRVMPTRLGNALRRHEDAAGRPYDVNAVGVMPHIALCAPPEHLAYLNDQRTLLDLSVRLCVVSLLAAAAGFVLLARDGLSLLLCLAPYLLAYVFYRGSIVAANQYGTAVSPVVALNRFRLYEQLHMPIPEDAASERQANALLGRLLAGERVDLPYAPPRAAAANPPRRRNRN